MEKNVNLFLLTLKVASSSTNDVAFEGRREWLTSLTMTRRLFVDSKNIEFFLTISDI